MFPISLRSALGPFAGLVLAACVATVAKAPVLGDPSAISELVGEWDGTYGSQETGRSGSIVFRLRAGADTAEGDVVMTAARSADPAHDINAVVAHHSGTVPQLLTIRFVMVTAGEVRGVLDPYRDPDCGCKLTTTFKGRISGDEIEGTFMSEGSGIAHIPAKGYWRVTRIRKAP